MPLTIFREEAQQLVRDGAQLVEVLPSSAYEKKHLPGAINIPLTELDRGSADHLDRHKSVIVYCFDFL